MKKGQYIATALSLLILALLSYLRLKKKSRHPFIFAFFIIPVVTYLGLYPLILLLTLTTGGLQDMLFSAVTWNLVKDLEYTHEMRLVVSISIKIFIYFLLSWLMTYWLISWIARRKFSKENWLCTDNAYADYSKLQININSQTTFRDLLVIFSPWELLLYESSSTILLSWLDLAVDLPTVANIGKILRLLF